MKNIVIVQSKTIDNESVPVVFNTVNVLQGGKKDIREISRSYIFSDFKAEIPFKLAQILVKQNPNEFSIMKSKDKKPTQEVKRVVKVAEEKREGFVCPHCGIEAKSKAGLLAHIRIKHPEKWEGKKTVKKNK